jgi:hypothetical protein
MIDEFGTPWIFANTIERGRRHYHSCAITEHTGWRMVVPRKKKVGDWMVASLGWLRRSESNARTIRWTEAGDRPLPDWKFTCPRSVIGGVRPSEQYMC